MIPLLVVSLTLAAPARPPQKKAPPPTREAQQARDAEETAARAAEAKRAGDAAMDAGRPADALVSYTEALRLKADPALYYNRARALEAMGQYPEALELLERFQRDAPPELLARVPRLDALLGEVAARTGLLTVRTTPPGAEVRLSGRVLGQTPLTRRLTAGTFELVVSTPDTFEAQRSLKLNGGTKVEFDLELQSRASHGLLLVKSPTVGAKVLVDEEAKGNVPVEVALLAGEHVVKLMLEGYLPSTNAVVIKAGAPTSIDVPLLAEPRFYERWYFWTLVGVGVAGITAGILAASIERPVGPGTLGGPFGAGATF
ncbi:MAG: PEGA domain-containing protein [Myxococcaceae bacterium]|nr:PEGA domain-containing protein [Myxococcaceae bacterium]